MADQRKRSKSMKTLPLVDPESTSVGAAPPGWELESTMVGAPAGWEPVTTDVENAPPGWSGQDDPTLEGAPALPPSAEHSRTFTGPPAHFDLTGGRPAVRSPHPAGQTHATAEPPPAEPARKSKPPAGERPVIEVEVRKISSAASVTRRPPPIYEIWTRNRVYALDANLTCIDVIDLASGTSDKRHPFVGGKLVGGQRRVGEANELTFPLPTPGAEAVFQTLDGSGRPRLNVTSKVTRAILHVQVIRVAEQAKSDTWGKITSSRNPGDPRHQ